MRVDFLEVTEQRDDLNDLAYGAESWLGRGYRSRRQPEYRVRIDLVDVPADVAQRIVEYIKNAQRAYASGEPTQALGALSRASDEPELPPGLPPRMLMPGPER